jgi:hypothetical protein
MRRNGNTTLEFCKWSMALFLRWFSAPRVDAAKKQQLFLKNFQLLSQTKPIKTIPK